MNGDSFSEKTAVQPKIDFIMRQTRKIFGKKYDYRPQIKEGRVFSCKRDKNGFGDRLFGNDMQGMSKCGVRGRYPEFPLRLLLR